MRRPFFFASALAAALVCTLSTRAEAQSKLDDLGPAHIWLKADLGVSFADLRAFSGKYPAPEGAAVGGLLGADAGVRWERFSVGMRGRYHPLTEFNLWQIAPFVGIHFPQRNYDLSATAHVGYSAAVERSGGRDAAKGLYTGVVVALDYLVAGPLLLGVGAGSDVLFLGGAPDRSNVGVGFTASLRLGLLFALPGSK